MAEPKTTGSRQKASSMIGPFVVVLSFALGIFIGFIFGFFSGQANQLTRSIVISTSPAAGLAPSATINGMTPTSTTAFKNISGTPTLVFGSPGTTLPKALTATPKPTLVKSLVITNDQATQMAAHLVTQSGIPIDNPTVNFLKDGISIHGTVAIASPIPGIRSVSGPITVIGIPHCANEDFTFVVSSVQSDALSFGEADIRNSVEQVVNNAFAGLLDSKRVQSCVLSEGKITVNYVDPF